MTFRTLLVAKAVVCLLFGIVLLFAPNQLLSLLGASLNAGGMFTARVYGASLVGMLLLTWFAKDALASDARGAILLDLLAYDGIGAIITLGVVLAGVLNLLGWVIVLVYGFFTVGSGYLLALERPFQRRHTGVAA